ncbi:MAG: alpha-glucan family phosphorylase [Burkholderiaceae bacterium]|nr:alpha-glucan family phosphorylase [Burkholderiaceae bacterium]
MPINTKIAYFSMEIGLADALPTYSGGLGVLAGDTIRSAADGSVPMVEDELTEMPARVTVNMQGRDVAVRAWRCEVTGQGGHVVPVFLLDTDLPENADADRSITDHLYGGDEAYRLRQEVILGIGGVRMLRALGYAGLRRFHMNEGHAALLVLELGYEELQRRGLKKMTPEVRLLREVLTDYDHAYDEAAAAFCLDGKLNMTYLALDNSHFVNGVAKSHGEVSRQMFTQYKVDSITNGVHAGFWTVPPIQALFDRHITAWRADNASLRYAIGIPRHEIWAAHQVAKEELIAEVNRRTGAGLFANVFTIGFARRATPYKRPDLLFHDLTRLLALHRAAGPIQIVYAGKAHPRDGGGKELIRKVFEHIEALRGKLEVVYLEDYDMALARRMVAGVDLWLNTPLPPLEASGTSGMKAAMNGVPQLSVLDGWWIEGCIEGVTGWAIANGHDTAAGENRDADAAALYNKLETVILPLYYRDRDHWINVMKHAIGLNGSFFNTERMVDQYVRKAYFA